MKKLFFALFLLVVHETSAQIQITFPSTRAVFQRDNSNKAFVSIAGVYTQAIDKVEARVTPMQAGQGSLSNWQTIQVLPEGGVFVGSMQMSGGWYKVEVRGLLGGVQVGNIASMDKIGVGEVFLIAGQSNAQGLPDDPSLGVYLSPTGALDDRVNCVSYSNNIDGQHLTNFPDLVFSHLDASTMLSPRGPNGWCWGALGDILAARLNVPILFYNAAWAGTSILNWKESAAGVPTKNTYFDLYIYPNNQPYNNLKSTLNFYTNLTGVRSVLWMQGETDALPLSTTTAQYQADLQYVINKSRADIGKNNLAWVIARTSRAEYGSTAQRIIDGQNAVISSTPNTFPGPATDNIQVPRFDFPGPHIAGTGLPELALAWNASLDNSFFSASTPQMPVAVPNVYVTCPSGNNTLTLTMPVGYNSYSWSNGEAGQIITVGPGTYQAKMKDNNGNIVFGPTVVVPANLQAAKPTITAESATTICTGSSVTLSSSNTVNNLWSNGATTQKITITASGTYSVTAKNIYGCGATSDPITVTSFASPPPATPVITATSTIVCEGGSIRLTSNYGGTNVWNIGVSGSSIQVSTAGSYSVKAVDANGCSSASSSPVSVSVNALPPKPIISKNGSTSLCAGGSIVLSSNYPNGNTWNVGDITPSLTVTSPGNYTVRYRDINGCVSQDSDPVTVVINPLPPAPTIIVQGSSTICAGESVVLGTDFASSYSWSSGESSKTIRVSNAGNYTVRIIDGNGCMSPVSSPITITVNDLPAPPVITVGSSPTTFCPDKSVQITSLTVGSSYLWSNGATTQAILVAASGSYTARVSNTNGCFSNPSNAILVNVLPTPPAPTITVSGATTFCEGSSVSLSSSSGKSYIWSNGATTSSITTNSTGSYFLKITDANGCISPNSNPINIVVNPNPIAPTITPEGSTTICQGKELVLRSSASAQYLWSTGFVTQTIKVLAAGSYWVKVIDSNGCASPQSSPIVLSVNPLPLAPIIAANGATTFCPDKNVLLTSSQGIGYVWSNGATTQGITINTSGTYTAQIKDANGCVSTVSNPIVINVLPTPPAPIVATNAPLTFCEGGSVILTSTEGGSYLWSNTIAVRSISVNKSGIYTVKITDANGCFSPSSAPLTVTVNPLPAKPKITTSGATSFCQGGSVTLTASKELTYVWNNGANIQAVSTNLSGKFALKVIDTNGCTSASSDTVVVIVNPLPSKPTITPESAVAFCANKSVVLVASPEDSYAWSNGQTTKSITITIEGSFSVKTINKFGCVSDISEAIKTKVYALPDTPVISATGVTTFCEGGKVSICSDNGSQLLWSNGEASSCIEVKNTGEYTATITDVNNCVSVKSVPVTVAVQILPSTPVITQIGAYTLEAVGAIVGDDYQWSVAGSLLAFNTKIIKANKEGDYTVRTRKVFNYPAPIGQLTCYSNPSQSFRFAYDANDVGMTIYPNPNTTGIFTVETKDDLTDADVLVYTIRGQIIYQTSVQLMNERKIIDLKALPNSEYVIQVRSVSGFKASKNVLLNQ